jgi:hypothetical protein
MSNQPPDKKTPTTKFIHHEQGEGFDVFRTDGNSSRLPGQHFPEGAGSRRGVVDHQLLNPDDHLSVTGTTIEALTNPLSLKQRIAQAKIAQQEALKQMHEVHDAAGPLIHHHIVDAEGPILERHIVDTFAFPPAEHDLASTNQDPNIEARSYQSASGPTIESSPDISLDLLERINKIKAVQQEALNQLHAMKDLAGPSDERMLEDATGPQQGRHLYDTQTNFVAPPQFNPEQQEAQQDETLAAIGPLFSAEVLSDALADKLNKAREAEQEALLQIKAMQDAQGPIQHQAMFAAEGSLITAPTAIRQGPIQTPDKHFNQQLESPASDQLPNVGPFISAPDHHLNVQIQQARFAQEQALGYLHAIQDGDGSIDRGSTLRAIGDLDPRVMADAQGDLNSRAMSDARGAIDPRNMHDATGPIKPRSLFDNIVSSFSRSFFNKQEPKPTPTAEERPEPTSEPIPESVPAPAPNKVSRSISRDDELNLYSHMNTMAERIAKVRSDQLKTMNDLDSLEKNTAEQIKRMEEKK